MSQVFTDDCYSLGMQATTSLQAFENNFAALKSAFSGATTPGNTIAGMWWFDTTSKILKVRNEANDAWQSVWNLANNKPVVTNIVSADFGAAIKDAAAATASLRTLGTGAAQACAGNDARLGIPDGSVTGVKLTALAAGMDIILGRAPTQRSTSNTSYTKLKEFTAIGRAGTVTVNFEMRSTQGTYNVNGRVYINGTAVGTEKGSTSSTFALFSENFNVNLGDIIQIYGSGSAFSACVIANATITHRELHSSTEVSGY